MPSGQQSRPSGAPSAAALAAASLPACHPPEVGLAPRHMSAMFDCWHTSAFAERRRGCAIAALMIILNDARPRNSHAFLVLRSLSNSNSTSVGCSSHLFSQIYASCIDVATPGEPDADLVHCISTLELLET